jgi:hypothetical protein
MAKVIYGPDIHEAIARGQLEEMRRLVSEAEDFLARHGDVSVALELLKAEIARAELRGEA